MTENVTTPDPLIPEPVEPDGGQDHAQDPERLSSGHRLAFFSVRDAETAAQAAEADLYNDPGYCLQQTREWAGIGSLYTTAATAWWNAERRQTSRRGRRGGFAFWTGGRLGYGHVGMILTNEYDPWVRSTDAGGRGIVATRRLSWFDTNWPSLTYVGWTDNVNGVTVPGVMGEWFEMADEMDLRRIVREELRDDAFIKRIGDEVWQREFNATNANDVEVKKHAREFLTSTWESVKKMTKST